MISFGEEELRDIGISVGVLAVAVSGIGPQWRGFGFVATKLIAVSLPLVIGFFAHETVHKAVAERYGYRSRYKLCTQGLLLALGVGIISSGNFLFAAPGAVMIGATNITTEEHGKISIAGPLTNLGVAAIFYSLTIIPGFWLNLIGYYGAYINLFLAFFNLLPIGPLDGRKIFSWRPKLSIVLLAGTGFLLFFVL